MPKGSKTRTTTFFTTFVITCLREQAVTKVVILAFFA